MKAIEEDRALYFSHSLHYEFTFYGTFRLSPVFYSSLPTLHNSLFKPLTTIKAQFNNVVGSPLTAVLT